MKSSTVHLLFLTLLLLNTTVQSMNKEYAIEGTDLSELDKQLLRTVRPSTYEEENKLSHDDVIKKIYDLIKVGANINARNSAGKTPLEFCMRSIFTASKTKKIVKFLISHGADVNVVDNKNESLFHIVIGFVEPNVFGLFVKADTNVFKIDPQGNTVLHLIAEYRNCRKFRQLFKNAQYQHQVTSLSYKTDEILKTEIWKELPEELLLHIFAYIPKKYCLVTLSTEISELIRVATDEQLYIISSQCPVIVLKQSVTKLLENRRSNNPSKSIDQLRNQVVAYRIAKGKELLSIKNKQGKTALDIDQAKNAGEYWQWLNPDNFEENFGQQIHQKVFIDLGLVES